MRVSHAFGYYTHAGAVITNYYLRRNAVLVLAPRGDLIRHSVL